MARPDVARRIKSYSAASGVVYTYSFFETQRTARNLQPGTEYVYVVAADRGASFPVRVFVRADSMRRESQRLGRPLTGTEEYAVAKMRLFAEFDSDDPLSSTAADLAVDDSNIAALLAQLDLG